MRRSVNRTVNDLQIFDGVVEFVPVKMVDNFVSFQLPTEVALHNVTVFKNTLSIDGDEAVSLSADSALPVRSLLPGVRVSMLSEALEMGRAEPQTGDAAITSNNGAAVWHRVASEPSFTVSLDSIHRLSSLLKVGVSILQNTTGRKWNDGAKRVNSGNPLTGGAEGNPEPSRGYTPGRCRDYRRGPVPLITGKSARPERDEIVHSPRKRVGIQVHDRL